METELPNNVVFLNSLSASNQLTLPNNVERLEGGSGAVEYETFNVLEGVFNTSDGAFNVRKN